MKKIVLVPLCLAAMVFAGNAQTKAETKQEPKPSLEAKKFAPPKIVPDGDKDFLARNPSVKRVNFKGGNVIILRSNDNKVEKFDLSDDVQNKAFVAKYGQPPVAPPPPPPAPPAPPKASADQKVKKTS